MIEIGFHAGGTLSRRRRIGKVEAPLAAPELPPRPVLFFGLVIQHAETAPHMTFDFDQADIVSFGKLAKCQIVYDMTQKYSPLDGRHPVNGIFIPAQSAAIFCG
jgi:hypothetical protein